jgi:DNA-binding transcriptional LysR family regulator
MKELGRRKADWNDLKVFLAVAQAGGVNAAARRLQVNPSTVTRALEDLERQLNAKLINRGPKGISLTEAGELALERVITMSRTAEALALEVGDSEAAPVGCVRLALPDGVASLFVTPEMPEFLRAHPELDLRLDCGLWQEQPLKGEADLTITYTDPTQPDAVAITLAHIHYGMFASAEYLSLYGTPTTVEEVLKHPYIHHVAQTHQREIWSERAAAIQVLTHKRLETNSSAVVVQAVRTGVGIGGLPTGAVATEPNVVMLDIETVGPVKLWLVHHVDATRSARVRVVKEWLKSIFDRRTRPWFREEFVHPRDFATAAEATAAAKTAAR